MGKMTTSIIKYNTRVIIPDPVEGAQEIKIQSIKERIINTTNQHMEESKNKESNLTKQERKGRKKIMDRMRIQDLVVIPTDKSGKLALMTKDTYREAAKEHIDKDEEVEWKQVKRTENTANRIAMSMGRILRMGQARN